MADHQSEIYVLSGANRGIGLELTRQLLAEGHFVYAGVRDPEKARDLASLCERHPGKLEIHPLDIGSDASVTSFAARIGTDTIDTLINNAGVYLDSDYDSTDVPAEQVVRSLDINAVGPLRLTQALLEKLMKAKVPRVANITSLMGSIGDNQGGSSVGYRMSKAALNMFTKTLALDEPKVITLSLHPGWVKTDMGGANAPVEKPASASGLLKVIRSAKKDSSGHFYNYDGRELPW